MGSYFKAIGGVSSQEVREAVDLDTKTFRTVVHQHTARYPVIEPVTCCSYASNFALETLNIFTGYTASQGMFLALNSFSSNSLSGASQSQKNLLSAKSQ